MITEKDYLSDPTEVELLPEVVPALQRLAQQGGVFAVASNQSGIGRGYFSTDDARAVNVRMQRLLGEQGIEIMHSYFCPHAPEDDCRCRKPKPFMLEKAMKDTGVEPLFSFMVGDKISDIEAGKNAGMRSILVQTGYGKKVDPGSAKADFIAVSMAAAAEWILDMIKKPG